MYRKHPRRTVWDRETLKPPPTPRAVQMSNIAAKKLLTITEAASYLNVTRHLVNKLIERGILEIVNTGGQNRYISHEALKGLLLPVRSLNKRLMLLEDLKTEINKKIERKKKELNNEDNRN